MKKHLLKQIGNYVLWLSALAICFITLTGYFGEAHYLLELTSHFKRHLLLAGLIVIPFALTNKTLKKRWKKALIVLTLTALLFNIYEVAPWYLSKPYKTQGDSETTIKLLTANIKFNNTDYASFLELVEEEQPDIIFLQELNPEWIAALEPLATTYSHSHIYDPGMQFGMGIWSKYKLGTLEIINSDILYVETPTILTTAQVNNQEVRLVNIHPMPPISKRLFKSRNDIYKKTAQVIRTENMPTILAGDFNTTMWSPHYKNFLQETGFKDTSKGFGVIGTWPVGPANYQNFMEEEKGKGIDKVPSWLVYNHPIRLQVDHILVSQEFTVHNIQAGPNINSDHLPLIAEIQIPN